MTLRRLSFGPRLGRAVSAAFVVLLAGALTFSGSTSASAVTGDAINPVNNTRTGIEGTALTVSPAGTVTSANYRGSYIEVNIAGVDAANETLSVIRVTTPSTANGTVSISSVNDYVYVGDGTYARKVGSVDATQNGLSGQPLRINLDPEFLSDPQLSSSTRDVLPADWTQVPDRRIILGTTQIAGFTSVDPRQGQAGYSAANPDATNDSLGAIGSSATTPDNTTFFPTNNAVATADGTPRFGLITNFNAQLSAGVSVFNNLGVYSSPFAAVQGDRIQLAVMPCNTNDTCHPELGPTPNNSGKFSRAYVALLRTDSSLATGEDRWTVIHEAEYQPSGSTYTNIDAAIPANGNYRLVMVAGAAFSKALADAGGVQSFYTQLRFKDFKLAPTITSTVANSILRKIQYTAVAGSGLGARTLNLTYGAAAGAPVSAQVSLTVEASSPTSSPTPTSSVTPVASASSGSTPAPPAVTVPSAAPAVNAPTLDSSPSSASPVETSKPAFDASDPAAVAAKAVAALFAVPNISINFGAPVANAAIGASGDDGAPPVPFNPLGSPEAITAMSGALAMAAALAGAVAASSAAGDGANADPAGGVDELDADADADAEAETEAEAEESGESDDDEGDEEEGEGDELDYERDEFDTSRSAWGDRWAFLALPFMSFFDLRSHRLAIRVARLSPLLSKLIVDGAYTRAMMGSLALLLPLATIVLGILSVQANHGEHLPPPLYFFMAMTAIGVLDAMAGFLGAVVFISGTLMFSSAAANAGELRMLFGILFVLMGPALLMTAFRKIRKEVRLNTAGVWERLTDFVIAPLMAGVAASTAIMVLPAMAGLTLPVANHVADFGLLVAVFASLRVGLEEFASRAFPRRLDRINADDLPESGVIQKIIALVTSYAIWVFMSGAISGEVWQVWVGSALFLFPVLMANFTDKFPNNVWIWRLMPQGMPGLIFKLSIAAITAMVVMQFVGINPEFAAWNMVLLPLPLLAVSALGMFGRHGATPHEIRYSQRNPWVFRLGGLIVLVVALRLMAVI